MLDIINRSPGDPQPVFETILKKAHDLCGADAGALMPYDGEHFQAVATHGLPDEFVTMLRRPFRGASHQRLIDGERIVHVVDAMAIPWGEYGDVVRLVRSRNVPSDFKANLEREPPRLDAGSLLSRAMREQTLGVPRRRIA